MPKEKSLVNWSEFSSRITGDRTRIRSDYSGKKYKSIVDIVKFYETSIAEAIELYKNANKKQ